MKADITYKIVGISAFILLGGSTYLSIVKHRRDKTTEVLLGLIQRELRSSGNSLGLESAFDIYYLQKVIQKIPQRVLVLKEIVANQYAKQLYSAWGSWYEGGDDEAKVYGIFRLMKDKVQVSQVAKAYQEIYAKNLIDVLRERFSSSEIKVVLNIIEGLPNYRIS